SYTDSGSKIWYSEDVDFIIGVTDALSGIRNITVKINGTELRNIDYYTSETHSADLTVNTSEAERNEDGSYTIYVEYTDNAGNTASTTSTIYKDIAVPVVTSVIFEGGDDASNSIWSDIWNLITFGIFYNDDVKVTVTARDDSPATGVKEYTLYIGGEEYAVSTDGVFTIAYEDYTSQKEITVTATDNVNNTCDQITPTSVDTNASNDTIMLEQGTSAITIDIPESADSAVRYDKDGNAWYSGDIDFTVNASDELSGIRTVTASINGTELYTKDYYNQDAKTTTADEFTVNTGDAVINDNGSYVILVTVTDNAGNVTTDTKTVYKDTAAPIVTDITFTANSSAWSETLNLLTFGIFFNSDVTVTVSAVDNDPTAGIKEYSLYVGDREAQTNTTGVFTISDEDYAAIELIRVTVTDNVLNTCSPVNPTSVNTNASNDGIMLENSSADIEITIPSQSDRTDRYTDSSNRIWYSGDIDYTVKVTDEGSGIRNITADINGTELFNEDYYEEESATAEKTLTLNTGDAVRNSDGSYVLTVTVTDNADNVSTKSQTVYKDTDVPVITSVEFNAESEESTWSEILNLLTFGIFYNDDVHVSVGARDDSPASGVKEYTLYVGGTEVETNTEGEFTISYENYTSQQEITVTATDNVGNTCARTTPSQAVDTNAQNDTIMLETTDGAITITIPDSTSEAVRFDRADGTVWYSGDIDFAVNVVDTQSGIRSITADINGTVLVNNSYNLLSEKTTNVSFSINTADAVRNDDGSYEITVVVTDNAGNQFEQSSVVYKDISTPVVTDITFTDEDGNTVDVLAEYGTYDAASGNYIIECQETIYAVITAADSEPSSGISDIGYTLTDAATGSTVTAADTDFTGYDTVSATRRVKINANFKGTLTAYVVDNVSNTSATVNPGSAIIETQATHNSEANHITMSLANYTEGYYYNTTVTPVITVKDTYAGIKDIVVEITANGSAYRTINASSLTSADGKGWTINSTDENLVTSASMSIPVTIESNNIIIKVTLTDNALNTSEQQYMFHIDLTAPVISCSLTSNATPVSGYYSDTVTANITVVEHNFNASAFSITEGSVTGWSNSGDVWTATATFSGEGEHQFTMSCTDLAGNTGTSSGSDGTFYVDLTDPVVTVQDMSYGQTNNDDDDISFSIVITDALRLSDSPLSMTFTVWYLTDDGVLASGDFTLDELQDMGFITYTSTSGTTEYTYTVSLIKDGIYSFVCTVTDMSGRTSSSILYSDEDSSSASVTDFEFSINREGSTYKVLWQDEDVSVENGQIASTGSTEEGIIQVSDIVITEYNPDAIDTEGDGTVISISQGVNMAETVNVDAETDESEKYSVNTYVISREDYFNEDGVYTLQIETTDAAGNVSNGISEDSESGETSKNYRSVSFTVDTTAPEVYADSDFTSYFSIQAEKYSFHIEIDDLTTCYLTVTATEGGSTYPLSVTLDGETVTAENLELSGSEKAVTLTLEEKSYDEIAIDVVDAVGLTYSDVKKSITISTSSLRVLFNRISGFLAENKWVYALIIGVPVLIVVLLIFVLRRKKKDDDNPENTKKKEKKSKDKKNKGKTGKK
ncbi:MAG: Ig-like domain repeat protein, partial [Clostridiales bacterium]|nr:Ig-like domain repeat protein [Clostridiales bacterium]